MLYSLSEIRNIPILFIVGKGRSGTTLLSTILDSHPKVASATESRFLLILWQKYKRMKKWNAAKAEVFFEDASGLSASPGSSTTASFPASSNGTAKLRRDPSLSTGGNCKKSPQRFDARPPNLAWGFIFACRSRTSICRY